MNKRVLIFTVQPPPFNGVQAIRYGKLIKPLGRLGWDLHFIGPDPRMTSTVQPTPFDPALNGHYISDLPLNFRAAILRRRSSGLARIGWLALQAGARVLEKIGLLKDFDTRVQAAMERQGRALIATTDFDLIAAIHPSFWALRIGSSLAAEAGKPFLAIYDDPHGARTLEGFTPQDTEAQAAVIEAANGVAFASPLTLQRYLECFPQGTGKMQFVTDSFLAEERTEAEPATTGEVVVHLGSIGPWRPIEPLLAALVRIKKQRGDNFIFRQYGFVYAAAIKAISDINKMNNTFELLKEVNYLESHQVAQRADIFMIIVGPRHIDNIPSKFFEYLPARKPILFVGPAGHHVGRIVENLGIGLSADVNSEESIFQQLSTLLSCPERFKSAYAEKWQEIQQYQVANVASVWATILDQAISQKQAA